jgi:hypothetical protein
VALFNVLEISKQHLTFDGLYNLGNVGAICLYALSDLVVSAVLLA